MHTEEIHENFIKTLGNEYPSYNTVRKWAADFKCGRETVAGDGLSDRQKYASAKENLMAVHTLVLCDRRQDLRSIASKVGDFIERAVTQDETWVHHFDPESKMKSILRKHPDLTPPKKF